jgi:hypothetical protein
MKGSRIRGIGMSFSGGCATVPLRRCLSLSEVVHFDPLLPLVFAQPLRRMVRFVAFNLVIILFVGTLGYTTRARGQGIQGDGQKIIRGTVVNAITREPIARALVTSAGDRLAALTDGEGNFEFTLPETSRDAPGADYGSNQAHPGSPGASLWLTARKPGFLDRPNEAGQVRAIPGGEVTISLIPEAVIKGRVQISTGDAASGIGVQLYFRQVQQGVLRWQVAGQTRTNSNGDFRFTELSPGSYKIVTRELMDDDPADTAPGGQAYGFAPVYYPGVSDFSSAATIQVAAGGDYEAGLSVVRQPYYPVSIPLVNREINGGVMVAISVQGHRAPEYSLGYNAGKHAIVGLLPNGTYLVEASTLGQNSATGAVNLNVAGAPVEGAGLELIRNSSVHFRVTEEFSNNGGNSTGASDAGSGRGPQAYLQIRAEAADDFALQSSATLRPPRGPGDDPLVIDDLPPGRYWLRITSSHGYVAAATMGGIDLLHQPFSVAPGSSAPIDITMRDDYAAIDGTVTDASASEEPGPGASPVRAYVYCVPLPDSTGQFQQLVVNDKGNFTSQTMTPGTYRLMAFRNPMPNLPYRDTEAMRAYDSTGQVVRLPAGQKTSLQLQISSGVE